MTKSSLPGFINKYKIVIIIFILALGTSLFARMYIKQGLSGDEPHYLVMAQSLKNDHDLDVKNNYLNKTYIVFYQDSLEPHINWALIHKDAGHWYSIHGPGLALLLAPTMYLGNRAGPLLFMLLVGVLVIIQIYRLGLRLVDKPSGIVAAMIVMTSISYLSLVGYIFPDMLAGLLILSALLALIQERDKPSVLNRVWLGAICGLMIVVHVKSTLIAFTLLVMGAALLYKMYKDNQQRLIYLIQILVPFVLIYGAFTLKLHAWYGVLLPNQMYQGNGQMLQLSPLVSVPAMLFDGFKGVLLLSPGLLLIFLGLPMWYRRYRWQVLVLLITLLPTFVIQSTFNDWGGGWGPPGRYLMMYIPTLAGALAFVVHTARTNKLIRYISMTLIALQLILTSLYILLRTTWGAVGSESVFYTNLQQKLGVSIPFLRANFDVLARPTMQGIIVSVLMVAIICGLLVYGYKQSE